MSRRVNYTGIEYYWYNSQAIPFPALGQPDRVERIRDTSVSDNQIVDKGVGEGKSGEFPLVQKRTESRSKRRNYQAEKYRKTSHVREE